jgi:hypothetical protein
MGESRRSRPRREPSGLAVNQAGGKIDEELKVRRLIPSDGTISIGSHGSHYIPLRCFSISPGLM